MDRNRRVSIYLNYSRYVVDVTRICWTISNFQETTQSGLTIAVCTMTPFLHNFHYAADLYIIITIVVIAPPVHTHMYCTILHVLISGELHCLAMAIIRYMHNKEDP
ncbi:hypothetical protein BX666DRAFT_1899352 [Dichotomocladium elegans]|nr:hypothetical protein BX666DRAFT_1899352 [Dichotomocladium elegans]